MKAILLIVFNRPAKTRQVVDFLLSQPPAVIYVAADGPRSAEEQERCDAVRAIADELSGVHELHKQYAVVNLGCGANVYSGLRWFFGEVEFGVIIEDDICPDVHFIQYCHRINRALLPGSPVGIISGAPFLQWEGQEAFTLSRFPNIWGWAARRELFDGYTLDLDGYSGPDLFGFTWRMFDRPVEACYWFLILTLVRSRRVDTWDFQLYFHLWKLGRFAAIPARGWTRNVGFDAEATHTKRAPKGLRSVVNLDGRDQEGVEQEVNTLVYSGEYDRRVSSEIYEISWRKVMRLLAKLIVTRKSKYPIRWENQDV